LKKMMLAIAVCVLAAPACATTSQTSAPSVGDEALDSRAYCRNLSKAQGGDYRIEENCLIEEAQSQKIMSSMQVPAETEQKCRKIARDAGGSYKVMEQCIQKELKGKGK
jgi:hypothetical protein